MSEYMFRAVLDNRAHPEYGAVSLPFPIPTEMYDHVIEDLLAPMQVGSPTMQDCVVKEVDAGNWPILKSLEGQCVNVDELDYLAKRLESFSVGEDAQFQGMAHKLGIIGIKDLINLTFCCQNATVIDNFRNLEKAGKDHLMNLNGGSMLMEELQKVDGKAVAEELIKSGSGKITPYGLVFDNGMELEQLYRGKEFPGYLYDRPEVVLTVVPFDAPADTTPTFLYLPCPQSQIDRSLQRGGLYGTDQMRVGVDCDFLPVEVSSALELENETFQSLNEMCRVVHGLSGEEKVKLNRDLYKGDFSAANMRSQYLEEKDYFGLNNYCAYIGGDYPLVQHRNLNAPSDLKILIIKDSYTLPFQAYLSTVFQEVDVIDPRHYNNESSVAEYIAWTKPDLVIMMISYTQLGNRSYYEIGAKELREREQSFSGKETVVENGEISLTPVDAAYNYKSISVQYGKQYVLTIDSVIVTEGETDGVVTALYDATTKTLLNINVFDIEYCKEKKTFKWTFSTPDSGSDELQLLFYAGTREHNRNNRVTYKGIDLVCYG